MPPTKPPCHLGPAWGASAHCHTSLGSFFLLTPGWVPRTQHKVCDTRGHRLQTQIQHSQGLCANKLLLRNKTEPEFTRFKQQLFIKLMILWVSELSWAQLMVLLCGLGPAGVIWSHYLSTVTALTKSHLMKDDLLCQSFFVLRVFHHPAV